MVIFIIAAAAAFSLCALIELSPKTFRKRLDENAHVLRLILFLSLLAAVLFIVVAAEAGPGAFGFFLFSLPILGLVFVMGNLLYRLPARPTPVPDEPLLHVPAAEWPRKWLPFTLLGLVAVALLIPIIAVAAGLPWLTIGTWLILASLCIVLARSAHPAIKWLHEQKWQTGLLLGSLLLTAVFGALIAWNGEAWAYAILLVTRRIVSMPETAHAVLGAVAGLMCGNFPRWIAYAHSLGIGHAGEGVQPAEQKQPPEQEEKKDEKAGKPASGIWPVIIFGGALGCVVLAALLAPYEQTALGRLSGVETPYLKLQFAISPSSAEREQNLTVARDLDKVDSLDAFPRTLRLIEYDCAQAALNASKSMPEFVSSNEATPFIAGLAFRRKVLPYVNRILNAQRRDFNPAVLKTRTRQVAEKFALLTANGNFEKSFAAAMADGNFEKRYLEAMEEIDRQERLFSDEQVEPKPAREQPNDPGYCRRPGDEGGPNARDIREVVQKKPRYILGFPAALFSFEGNIEAANAITNIAYFLDEQTDDINLIAGRADALYLGGQDLREVIPLLQAGLQKVESRLAQAERAKVWNEQEVREDRTRETANKIRTDLVNRYRRARFIDRLELAYIMAQHGLLAEEDLLPQRDLNWWSAQKYADEAYEILLDPAKSPLRFECDSDLRVKDYYAFVKLAYQASNLKNHRIPPEEFQVRQARGVLEDALAQARDEHRRLMEAKPSMARGGAAPSCFTEQETRAWIKQILSHLKLADALRP
jgi:hypothetical protein